MSNHSTAEALVEFTRRFDRILCVSLARCNDRRSYINSYFSELGINNFEFFDATDQDDPVTGEYYGRGLVASFPPCFRCGEITCGSDHCNNILIPPQVATFITYLRLWKELIDSDTGTALIVEDDVRFTERAGSIAASLDDRFFESEFRPDKPALLRLGWALCPEHESDDPPSIQKDMVRMSNPCHALTQAYARRLIGKFSRIETTVDIYQHRDIGEQGGTWTLFPPLAYELSWSLGAVDSQIQPKSVRVQYLEKHHPQQKESIQSAKMAVWKTVSHIMVRPLLLLGHPYCGSMLLTGYLGTLGLDIGHEKTGRHGTSAWAFAVDDKAPNARDQYASARKHNYFSHCIHYVLDPRLAIPAIIRGHRQSIISFIFICEHVKQKFGIDLQDCSSETEQAALSYLCWNELIKDSNPAIVIRLEDSPETLVAWLQELNLVGTVITRQAFPTFPADTSKIDRNSLTSETREKLDKFCELYNYPPVFHSG